MSDPIDPLLIAELDEAAKVGKRVVCKPDPCTGWRYEAWRDDDGHICWRENLGKGPEAVRGPRGPIRRDPPPRADDLGWIVTAT